MILPNTSSSRYCWWTFYGGVSCRQKTTALGVIIIRVAALVEILVYYVMLKWVYQWNPLSFSFILFCSLSLYIYPEKPFYFLVKLAIHLKLPSSFTFATFIFLVCRWGFLIRGFNEVYIFGLGFECFGGHKKMAWLVIYETKQGTKITWVISKLGCRMVLFHKRLGRSQWGK